MLQWALYPILFLPLAAMAVGASMKMGRWMLFGLCDGDNPLAEPEEEKALFRCLLALIWVELALLALAFAIHLFYGLRFALLPLLLLPLVYLLFGTVVRGRYIAIKRLDHANDPIEIEAVDSPEEGGLLDTVVGDDEDEAETVAPPDAARSPAT